MKNRLLLLLNAIRRLLRILTTIFTSYTIKKKVMADITITVSINSIYREVARRSAVATETDPFYAQKSTEDKQYSQLQGEGDRITGDFTKEAAKEVLKAYLSRQGDVVGIAYEYDRVSFGVKQKEIITVTGTGGQLNISGSGGLSYTLTYSGLPDTIADAIDAFVLDHAAAYLVKGIVITRAGDTLILEASVAGVPFTAPSLSSYGDLHGTVEHTTSNVSVGTGTIVYRFSENAVPLSTNQTNAIVDRLTNNTKDAIVYYVLVSLYRTDGNVNKEKEVLAKALSLIDELSGDLYRLHD
jgi:hypothetical protein